MKKSYFITLFLSFFFGTLGIHRFYVRKIGTGILMFLTAGGFGIWYLTDLLLILFGKFQDKKGNAIKSNFNQPSEKTSQKQREKKICQSI